MIKIQLVIITCAVFLLLKPKLKCKSKSITTITAASCILPLPISRSKQGQLPPDHPLDHPGKYFYCAGTFWLYLHSHCRLRNVTLVCVLCAYNGDLTMTLV